ncbi:hypothetical protein NQ314_007763 [Rhamnusium bicolor]|uniref:DDE Tnp4 domain-containing protein n=1 Tax=Rhamnusium bicolor TaxID=1586634 RepID=A0AAV8YI20_9CUCU|nr:hypothetical protein NQ314_007763 [Rhamnusium bicolor]
MEFQNLMRLALLEQLENANERERNRLLIAARRNIRDENDPFSLPDIRFIELFRVDKELARHLIDLLRPHIAITVSRRGIRVEKKVCGIALLCHRNEIKTEFMNKYGFPGALGAIDGTHIAILKPSEDEHNFINSQGWLIGDSVYPQSSILMTPFRDPAEGTPEARYNFAHIRSRNTIQRCIGVLKSRFRGLLKERTARYAPNLCAI